jgi:hypothetical protein
MCVVLPLNYLGIIGGAMLGVVSFSFLATRLVSSVKKRFKGGRDVKYQ